MLNQNRFWLNWIPHTISRLHLKLIGDTKSESSHCITSLRDIFNSGCEFTTYSHLQSVVLDWYATVIWPVLPSDSDGWRSFRGSILNQCVWLVRHCGEVSTVTLGREWCFPVKVGSGYFSVDTLPTDCVERCGLEVSERNKTFFICYLGCADTLILF